MAVQIQIKNEKYGKIQTFKLTEYLLASFSFHHYKVVYVHAAEPRDKL